MKVFITKYIFTQGIIEKEAEVKDTCASVPVGDGTYSTWKDHYYKPDWHATREEAVARAEEVRLRMIASLKKRVAKLEKLRFK